MGNYSEKGEIRERGGVWECGMSTATSQCAGEEG